MSGGNFCFRFDSSYAQLEIYGFEKSWRRMEHGEMNLCCENRQITSIEVYPNSLHQVSLRKTVVDMKCFWLPKVLAGRRFICNKLNFY